jgi:hypothetical protein
LLGSGIGTDGSGNGSEIGSTSMIRFGRPMFTANLPSVADGMGTCTLSVQRPPRSCELPEASLVLRGDQGPSR